jgi:hypothetical protein
MLAQAYEPINKKTDAQKNIGFFVLNKVKKRLPHQVRQ